MSTFYDTDYEGLACPTNQPINQFYILPIINFEYVREDWCKYNAIVFGWLFWSYCFEF